MFQLNTTCLELKKCPISSNSFRGGAPSISHLFYYNSTRNTPTEAPERCLPLRIHRYRVPTAVEACVDSLFSKRRSG